MSSQKNKALSAAILGGLGMGGAMPAFKLPRYSFSKTYPHSSTRQSERLERQRAKGMIDFSASERCLAAIKAR